MGFRVIENYCQDTDTTFLTKAKYLKGELQSIEVVGFYHGEPNESDTIEYSSRHLKSTL